MTSLTPHTKIIDEFDEQFPSTKNMQLDISVWHKKTDKVQSHRDDMHDFLTNALTKRDTEWKKMIEETREEWEKSMDIAFGNKGHDHQIFIDLLAKIK